MLKLRDIDKQLYQWDDNSNSKAGANIKGITETQADLLASYLNAIRLDVSVDRPNIQKIADAVAVMPKMSNIAQSQLTALQAISRNTLRNADAAEQMLSLMKLGRASCRERV